MIEAPAAGWQALDLEMRIRGEAPWALLMDVATIVEDTDARKLLLERDACLASEAFIDPLVLRQPVLGFLRIQPHFLPRCETGGADAVRGQDDIEEEPGRVVSAQHLARLCE